MPRETKYTINKARRAKRNGTKYIFVSGGVMSALGKGVTSASIAMLLKSRGFKVCPIKCENYLNVDAGTMNPIEHGDPFLCADGLEADQDLGYYERFLGQEMGKLNFITMGDLYSTVIGRERRMEYDGEDVEPISHIVNEIIDRIHRAADETEADFVVVELGGTVGEYENNNGLYYEAARIIALNEPVAHVHVTYVPLVAHIGEQKTKPAQMGLKELMRMGIQPNFIVVRSEQPIDDQRKYKFALKFHIDPRDVFSNENLSSIYEVPLHLHGQEFDDRILKYFGVNKAHPPLARGGQGGVKKWQTLMKKIKSKKRKEIKIAIVGKYFGTGEFELWDSYYSLVEAIKDAALENNIELELVGINSDKDRDRVEKRLKGVKGVIVPIGWGTRGVNGKIEAIRYAREKKMPYLGLCYGMQLACVEYARNVVGLKNAHTEEVDPKAKYQIIHSIPFNERYQVIKGDGVSMRLGTYDCVLEKGSLAWDVYEKHSRGNKVELSAESSTFSVQERHRHRYEFNNEYKELLEKYGLVFSGMSPDGMFVEMIELPRSVHPFFLATQGHPEYKSRPLSPHPVFIEFIKAAMKIA